MKKTLLFFTLLITFLSYGEVPDSEREALLAFYNSTDGPNWEFPWNTDFPVDNWKGITVENDHVVEINLQYNNLTGSLPSDLLNLPYLRILDLSSNNLSGVLPDFSQITTWEEIDLAYNNLEGNLPDFSNATSLRKLIINNNNFRGAVPDLTSLPGFSELKIENNFFQFGDFENQYTYYKNNLETFTYSPQLKIDEEIIIDITLGQDYTFEISPVSGTNLTYQWFKNEEPIDGANELTYNINNAELQDAADYVCKVYSSIITDLIIERNIIHLYAPVLQEDKDALMALYNATDGPNWTNNTNWGTDEPVYTWFGIHMEGNRVTRIVFDDYKNGNNLVGELPAEVGNLSALKELNIMGNQELKGSIPIEIGNLTELKTLVLWNNALIGNIPAQIGNLIKLEYVSFEDNFLTGNIPESFANLTKMKSFWVNGNLLSGDLPYIFDNWSNLIYISIGRNLKLKRNNQNTFTGYFKIDSKPDLLGVWTESTNIQGINVKYSEEKIKYFMANDCSQLTCIVVSDVNASYLDNWFVPDDVIFMETDENCGALDIPYMPDSEVSIYPNPGNEFFNIKLNSDVSLKNVLLYDISGNLVKDYDTKTSDFSIRDLSKGIYFIHALTNKGNIIKKLIIN